LTYQSPEGQSIAPDITTRGGFISMHEIQTIIIGGGMAGMSCAMRLKAYNRPFTLITDRLGGRVLYDPERKVNYGALFVMQNYHYARKILTTERWVNTTKVMFHDSDHERFATLSKKLITVFPSMLRFVRELVVFSRHYEKFKRNWLVMPMQAALRKDPYMDEVFHKPAADFVVERGLDDAVQSYVGKFIYACTLTTYDHISAFDLMTVSLGLLLPVYLFSFDEDAMKTKLQKELVLDTVVSVTKKKAAYEIKTAADRSFKAANVVLATPAAVTAELLGLPAIRGASKAYTFHVKGRPKPIYTEKMWNLFSNNTIASALIENWDGTFMLYTCSKEVDLSVYFDEYHLIERFDWEKAMYVHGRAFVPERFDERLLIAGDHNGLGLEPTCISGIHAANQIIKNTY